MLIFLVALSAVAVMVFVEWQYSVMGRRVRAKSNERRQKQTASRARRN